MAYTRNEPEFNALWSEIPNYNRLIFHPISMPEPRYDFKKEDNDDDRVKNRPQSCFSEDLGQHFNSMQLNDNNHERPSSWHCRRSSDAAVKQVKPKKRRKGIPKGEFLACLTEEDATTPQDPHREGLDEDQELRSFVVCDNVQNTLGSELNDLRCPAPSPMTMLKGKPVVEEVPTTKSTPPSPLKTAQNEHVEECNDDIELKTRRLPPPRPEGMPPLNLDVVKRQQIETIASPRLLSPRVQKPPTNYSSPPSPPDHSKSLSSIQSPRSAFSMSMKDLIGQKT